MSSNIKPLLPHEAVEVVVEGSLTEPQLNHPEGICADEKGMIWCGGEKGEIYRVDPAKRTFSQVATTDGFALGMNFDESGMLYVCDSKHRAVFQYDPATGALRKFSDGSSERKMRFPNYPLYDKKRKVLYVSDSYGFGKSGPGIWRIDVATGQTEMWCDRPFDFANGLALSPDGATLYMAESRGERNVYAIRIGEQGEAANVEVLLSVPGTILDGLVMAENGRLYITCYEPSRIYRIDTASPNSQLELLVEDPTAHELCHPTNGVLVGEDLYLCNLGRWHLSRVSLRSIGI